MIRYIRHKPIWVVGRLQQVPQIEAVLELQVAAVECGIEIELRGVAGIELGRL